MEEAKELSLLLSLLLATPFRVHQSRLYASISPRHPLLLHQLSAFFSVVFLFPSCLGVHYSISSVQYLLSLCVCPNHLSLASQTLSQPELSL